MACKVKGCDNENILENNYCETHLCERYVKGKRCKRKKITPSPFCWSHHYFINKAFGTFTILGLVFTIIGLILTVYMLPIVQNYLYGKLIIDFKENEIELDENGVPSVKIEVVNKLGRPLLYVNGTATLICENLNVGIKSQTFKLKGGHEFLADDSSAEFLLSPDPFFVDLVKTKNYQCSDMYIYLANYKKMNNTYAKLVNVFLFEMNKEKNGSYVIINKTYNNAKSIVHYDCLKCDVSIKIESQNYKQIEKKESHLFVSGSTTYPPFLDIIKIPRPEATAEGFFLSVSGYPKGTVNRNLCNKAEELLKIGIKCDDAVLSSIIGCSPIFANREFISE